MKFFRMRPQDLPLLRPAAQELHVEVDRLERFLREPHNLAFLAVKNEAVVGFAYGYALDALNQPAQLFLYSIDVLKSHQNQGTGSAFFQYIVDYGRERGCSECFVITEKANRRACRVYEKAGGVNENEDEIVYVIQYS